MNIHDGSSLTPIRLVETWTVKAEECYGISCGFEMKGLPLYRRHDTLVFTSYHLGVILNFASAGTLRTRFLTWAKKGIAREGEHFEFLGKDQAKALKKLMSGKQTAFEYGGPGLLVHPLGAMLAIEHRGRGQHLDLRKKLAERFGITESGA